MIRLAAITFSLALSVKNPDFEGLETGHVVRARESNLHRVGVEKV